MSETSHHGPVVVILAAGAGSRMNSSRAKVLHTVGGHSLLRHAIDVVEGIEPSQIVVVVGHQRDQVRAQLTDIAPGALVAVQDAPVGTGDAVRVGLGVVAGLDDQATVVAVCADVPLLQADTLHAMMVAHRHDGDAVTVLGPLADDAADAGAYVFDFGPLTSGLAGLSEQAEIALADVVAYTRTAGGQVGVFNVDDDWQARSVDDRVALAAAGAEYNRRQVLRWMRTGVTILDPASTWIEADVDLAPDVTLLPGTLLVGATSVARGATIGPETTVKDSEIGERATIVRSHVELSVVGEDATVGPFARLRPGSQIGPRGVVGSFVEIRNTTLGDDARVGANAVLADADVSARAPITIGAGAIVGCGALIVSPAEIADGQVVPPGTAVRGGDVSETRRQPDDANAEAPKRGLEEDK